MARQRTAARRVVPSLLLLIVAVSCASSSPEQQVLIDFFEVSRLADHTRLANIATTSFEPNVDGSVDSFAIVSTGAGDRRALDLRDDGNRALAEASLTPPGQPTVALTGAGVEAIRKTVTIDATLRPPDGPVTRARLTVTIQRAVDGAMREGRWIVTGVERAGARRG